MLHELLDQKKLLQKCFPGISRQIYRNPNQEIRIMDWVFPLNSDCLKFELDQVDFMYRPMVDILAVKEISDIIYDSNFDHYVINLHDKSGPFPLAGSINSSRYFIEWLNSCGNTSARKLAIFMEKFTEKLFRRQHTGNWEFDLEKIFP